MNDTHVILGIHVTDRLSNAAAVQKVFTEYGCNIKTRVGLHDIAGDACSPTGVVLIEFHGPAADADAMMDRLNQIGGVQAQKMVFEH